MLCIVIPINVLLVASNVGIKFHEHPRGNLRDDLRDISTKAW